MDEERQIDWSTATVTDGALAVELTGEPSRAWARHMEAVLTRLDPRAAAAVRVTKRRVKVTPVTGDAADELRHLLESAAHQTNVDRAAEDEGAPDADGGRRATDEAAGDRRLETTFREFAPSRGDQGTHGS